MKFLTTLSDRLLCRVWAGLYVLTAALSFLFPGQEHFLLRLATAAFFLPPWLLLLKSRQNPQSPIRRRIRWLALASLALTLVLLCLSIRSLTWGEGVGNLIHILMGLLCAPLLCGDFYALALFGWATLLFGSFQK